MKQQLLIVLAFLDYHISDDKEQYKDENGFWEDIENLEGDWNVIVDAVDLIANKCEEPEELDNYTYIMVYGGQIRIATHYEGVLNELVELINLESE